MADKHEKEIDELSGVDTTGHEWDGIKELNNPLPKWWLWTFYGTVIWALLYTIAYPSWPLIDKAFGGVLGYSSRAQVEQELARHAEAQKPWLDRIAALDLPEIASDAELAQFANAGGAAIFRTYCSQCHGAGAQGAKGYPNLNDDDWLWGGDLEAIHYTINHGVRAPEDEDTRDSVMPAFGDGTLDKAQIAQVIEYVRQISGQEHDADLAAAGAEVFADNCAACHGEDGKGNRDIGAPNLTDHIWLYGGDRQALLETLLKGRAGMMPAWGKRLTDAQVKQVALYVHQLGGGE
ncbi:cytochrome-c oxidase, cbb3-type subunit III [Oceanicella actignis]|uniref:Cbb3-type cytochrome c oxidase subunit n=1 Tax=Oceanicella actignis TaxID=1189325 RepID=A0A1M7TJM8_9RHOB|nr:cytochrome-c oxidase, cbb3-type subunit III [Oceanicella actignis]TYO88188.1 cytochrome c oxidase cbb3-type subunit 3 [Oceanicella actignis]SET66990.1 cytochrome c oxidase cbb3-type subunit 3 [Oceanicella actignis]SHN70954.1 cytochrome c oxidase cbb3-type subunit 3 [Oceanicella actignis]